MAFADLHHTVKLALVFANVFIVYQLVVAFNLARKRRAIAREKGCLPAPIYPQWDRVFGCDLFRHNMRAFHQRHFLELSYNRFRQMGVNTYFFVALGRRMHVTIEPENLKTIQAVEFKKWGLGKRRKIGFRPLLGDGMVSRIRIKCCKQHLTSVFRNLHNRRRSLAALA